MSVGVGVNTAAKVAVAPVATVREVAPLAARPKSKPEPLNTTVCVPGVALLVMLTAPERDPATCGMNAMASWHDAPTAIVPVVQALVALADPKSPVTPMFEIASGAPPLFVSVIA